MWIESAVTVPAPVFLICWLVVSNLGASNNKLENSKKIHWNLLVACWMAIESAVTVPAPVPLICWLVVSNLGAP